MPELTPPPSDQNSTAITAATFGLIKISGPDSKKFLQGQLTCNMEAITAKHSRLAAHCNPQGRVLALFQIFYFEEAYYLLLPASMVLPTLGFLKKYAVFFKLKLEQAETFSQPALQALAVKEEAYFDLRKGIPQVYPATSGKFLPHDLNLQHLDALSFDKGCYTGQEIIARMHYRGKPKNHLYRALLQTEVEPKIGADLYYQSPEGPAVGGTIVDCLQEAYNKKYQLLLVASEASLYKSGDQKARSFSLEPQQNETWEWLF